jgi:hypothetical protein
MSALWRRGGMGLLGALLGIFLLVSVLAGAGIMFGLRQPGRIWAAPVGRGYFAIGRIVSNECRRMQARGSLVRCAQAYGAVLYLPHTGSGGYGVEYTLFAIPDPQTWR